MIIAVCMVHLYQWLRWKDCSAYLTNQNDVEGQYEYLSIGLRWCKLITGKMELLFHNDMYRYYTVVIIMVKYAYLKRSCVNIRECSQHSEGQYDGKEKVDKCWINFLECVLTSQSCFEWDLNVFATHWNTFLKVSKNIISLF